MYFLRKQFNKEKHQVKRFSGILDFQKRSEYYTKWVLNVSLKKEGLIV